LAGSIERKLTTIFCADVKGYSRLMDADEVATLERLKDYRSAMAGFIERHRGRVVSTAGDGLLAEFPSVVEAVQCAVESQRELAARNQPLPESQRMDFRLGINLGDVMVEGEDIFGEGVNIAARLQELAPAGGICISRTVHDQVRNKLTLGYHFLGGKKVKNIADEVPVYQVLLEPDAVGGAPEPVVEPPPAVPQSPSVDDGDPVLDRRRRSFIRLATRSGILLGFLLIVNLWTSPGYLWVIWPGLVIGCGLAWRALSVYGPGAYGKPGHDRIRHRQRGKIKGDVRFTEDTDLRGDIKGTATVAEGVALTMRGDISRDLILEKDADAYIRGDVGGDVINNGGRLDMRGTVKGTTRKG
jgi:adenylate cyclase